MCAIAPILAVAALAGSLIAGRNNEPQAPAPAAPQVQTYTSPDTTQLDVAPPPTPAAAPTFGQKSAEDLEKDANADVVRKNKKGRAALRIDRNVDTATGLSAGGQVASGAVIPRG